MTAQLDALLEVQAHDTKLDQLRHQLATLPARAARDAAVAALAATNAALAAETATRDELARDQKRLDLLACTPDSGACAVILSETSPHWVELSDDFHALADGDFLWSSERSGYRHLYLYRRDGKLVRQITSGDWPVAALAGVDERHRRLFFTASKDDPLGKQVWSVAYDRRAAPRRVTGGDGVWSATFADRGTAFVGTFSNPTTPPQTALYDADGRRLRWIEQQDRRYRITNREELERRAR